MEYKIAYYLLWKEEHLETIRLKADLEEIMASYKESIEIQKKYLAALKEANQKILDLEKHSRWCCLRTR